jgi:hypothetical protein
MSLAHVPGEIELLPRNGAYLTIGVIGDSRTAGAGAVSGSAFNRAALGQLGPMLTMALGGRGVVIAPGKTFRNAGNAITLADALANNYWGHGEGSRTIDTLQGRCLDLIEEGPDVAVVWWGYNSVSAGATGPQIIRYMEQYAHAVERLLDRGIKVMAITIWTKDPANLSAVTAFNVALRDLMANTFGNNSNVFLLDIGDQISALPTTYFTLNESPQVHWSGLGARYAVSEIEKGLVGRGWLSRTPYDFLKRFYGPFTNPAENGAMFSNTFAGTGATSAPTGWDAGVGDLTGDIDAGGTSVQGSRTVTSFVDSARTEGRVSQVVLNSGGFVRFAKFTDDVLLGKISEGDRLAFCMGVRLQGMESGNSHFTCQVLLRKSGSTVATMNACYRMQADAGDWNGLAVGDGLIYSEFSAEVADQYDAIQVRCSIEQADDLAFGVARTDTAGSTMIAWQPTVINLTSAGLHPRR